MQRTFRSRGGKCHIQPVLTGSWPLCRHVLKYGGIGLKRTAGLEWNKVECFGEFGDGRPRQFPDDAVQSFICVRLEIMPDISRAGPC